MRSLTTIPDHFDWEYNYPPVEWEGWKLPGLVVAKSQLAIDTKNRGSNHHGESSADPRRRKASHTETDSINVSQIQQRDRKLTENTLPSSGPSSPLLGAKFKAANIQNDFQGKPDARAVTTIETPFKTPSLGTGSSLSQQGDHQTSIPDMSSQHSLKKEAPAADTTDEEVSEDSSVILTDPEESLQDAASERYEADGGYDWDDSSETSDDNAVDAAMLNVFERPHLRSALREIYAVILDQRAPVLNSGREFKKCPGGKNTSSARVTSGGVSTGNQFNSREPRKRRAVDRNDDGDGERQGEPGAPGSVPSCDTAESKVLRFACPYQKYAPDRFLEGACVRGGFKDIPKVK